MANGFILPEVTTISATVKFPAKTPIPVSNDQDIHYWEDFFQKLFDVSEDFEDKECLNLYCAALRCAGRYSVLSNIVCTGSTMEFTFTFPVDALDKFKRDFFVRKSN